MAPLAHQPARPARPPGSVAAMKTGTTGLSAQWTTWVPIAAAIALVLGWGRHLPGLAVTLVGLCLVGAVLAAVHHAEVVAHRVGEPFGSLVLAVAVTVIEVGLIVTLMAGGGVKASTYARDTVFAAVMITCNGIVGLSLLVAALRNRVAVFHAEGSGGALATVCTLATMTLVLPTFTTSRPGPEFTTAQLTFAAVSSLCLYGALRRRTDRRHRDYFLPVAREGHGATLTNTPRRPVYAGPGGASRCCSWRSSPSSATPNSSRPPSRAGWSRQGCRSPSSASSSP